jgi:hypothetical protein
MDIHFYDFTFQREVQVEGIHNPGWNTWTRANDGNDNPSPKKQKKGEGKSYQGGHSGSHDVEAGTSAQQAGKQHSSGMEEEAQKTDKCHGNQGEQIQDVAGKGAQEDNMQGEGEQDKEMNTSQESEDSIAFDELISPGGHWNFPEGRNQKYL